MKCCVLTAQRVCSGICFAHVSVTINGEFGGPSRAYTVPHCSQPRPRPAPSRSLRVERQSVSSICTDMPLWHIYVTILIFSSIFTSEC